MEQRSFIHILCLTTDTKHNLFEVIFCPFKLYVHLSGPSEALITLTQTVHEFCRRQSLREHLATCAVCNLPPLIRGRTDQRGDDDVFTIVVALLRCHFGQWLIESRTRERREEPTGFSCCVVYFMGWCRVRSGGLLYAWLSYNPLEPTIWAFRVYKWFKQGCFQFWWLQSRWVCFVNQFVSNSGGEQYVPCLGQIRSLSCFVFTESHQICPLAHSPLLTLSRPRLLYFIHPTLNMKDISQLKIRGERGVIHSSQTHSTLS